ncbi:MAG: hypothetical protein H6738_08900 [Alphaproteobacteria bacterium]|nr:hypothetical protein [Alphaproteobacteria bacterium]MCB9696879.1 hypothetical protein [Alphaproteobacteria bacterium]
MILTGLLATALAADPIRSSTDGFSVTPPQGWKAAQQPGVWLLGSETEAGLMTVSYTAGLGVDALRQQAAAGLQEDGLMLVVTSAPQQRTVAGHPAIVADYQGLAADGTPLRAHGVGVVGARGAVVVLGLTTPEQIAGLTGRVDATAGTVAFFEPELGKVSLLAGTLCSYSGGSSFSSTQRMSFDGKGSVAWGSELVGGGDIKDSLGDTTASWSVISGNQNQTTSVGTYAIQGDEVRISWPDGTGQTCTVHFRQGDGRITELMCGGKLYGAPLCG